MRFMEIAENNLRKLREVGRKLASKLTKLQIAVITAIISLFLLYLGFFKFGQFLRDVVFIISFAAIAGQFGYFLYSHGAKYAKNKAEKAARVYEDESWDGDEEEPAAPVTSVVDSDMESDAMPESPAGGSAYRPGRRRNPYRRPEP